MTAVLSHDAPVLKIALTGNPAARLFGVPFLLVGAYMAYQLAFGIADIATGRAALGEMLAGTLVLVLFTGAFLVPGWVLTFARARVEIDRTARRVTSVRDFRVYAMRDMRPLSDFDRIEVDVLSVGSNKYSAGNYQVELASPNRKNVVVGLFGKGDEAFRYGQELGRLIGLPIDDLRHVERDFNE